MNINYVDSISKSNFSKETDFYLTGAILCAQRAIMERGLHFTEHGSERVQERDIPKYEIMDAINHPLTAGRTKVDQFGRRSLRILGRRIEVVLNPDTGRVISANRSKPKRVQAFLKTYSFRDPRNDQEGHFLGRREPRLSPLLQHLHRH